VSLSRRNFLTLLGASTATTAFLEPLKHFYRRAEAAVPLNVKRFGELVLDSQGIFDLPKGFQYRILATSGKALTDGQAVPLAPDGMAAFPLPGGKTALICNHEIGLGSTPAAIAPKKYRYDNIAAGGTTTLVINSQREVEQHYVSLAGTIRNCAGGATPWGTWVSCEEDVTTPTLSGSVQQKHGYNFEVSPTGIQPAVPLKAMGRFNHEAIAVDPATGYVYQTEDRNDSCIYRFRPNECHNLNSGGQLEALAIAGQPTLDTSKSFPLGELFPVDWIPLENVDPDEDTLRYEAQAKGAAIFKRGEGMIYGQGKIYWTCTNGGNDNLGQIFAYQPATNELSLFVEATASGVLQYPDNLTLAPFGDLIVCEDGVKPQYLYGVSPQGDCYHLGRNALNDSELAGICFAPDGRTMFVNIQRPGLTLAI
jgi:secreted PhoX family phosphatase